MAGRIAFSGPGRGDAQHDGCHARTDRGAHANTASTSGASCRGSATMRCSCASHPGAGCVMQSIGTHGCDRYNRHRPQRRTARAAGRIRFAAVGIKPGTKTGVKPAARGKLSDNARLPPRGVSPLLTSPCPAPYAGRLGRSPLFATGASSRRPLRPCGRIRRMNSLYQPSVTVGARCQPNVPVGPVPADADFRACNSLLLNFRGKQLAPGASKITVYRLLPAQAARFQDPTDC
jgi:hypothetical protein